MEKIFSMLSYCASLHPANADPSASFMNAGADAEDGGSGGQQASLFAAMGLDPSSMVFANPDGSLGGPGLAAMQQQQQFEDGAEEGEEGEAEEEAAVNGGAAEESRAGRQRSDFVNEGRARGAPY